MTMDSPIVALAFTPDGAFIAGATCEKILIWKVGEHNIPRASWSRRPHPGWLSPRANNEKEQYEHCLCWDATGQKLAYGANSRVCLVFSPGPLGTRMLTTCHSLPSSISGERFGLSRLVDASINSGVHPVLTGTGSPGATMRIPKDATEQKFFWDSEIRILPASCEQVSWIERGLLVLRV